MFTKEKFKFKVNFRPIVVVFLSLLFGLISARKLYVGDGVYIALVVLTFLGLLVYSCLKFKYVLILLAGIFFFVGNGLYFLSYSSFMGREYQDAVICGRVSEVQEWSNSTTLYLEDVVAAGDSVNGVKISVFDVSGGEFQVGDMVIFNGSLEHNKMFTLGSFQSSYYRENIAYTCEASYKDFVSVVSGDLKFDEKARNKIWQTLSDNMDEKYATVAFAVLTGEKDFIEMEIKSDYRQSGIIHILTVSGLHVTFLTTLIAWALKKCKVNRFVNFFLTFDIILFYAYICGFAPSIVRAMIMGLMLSMAGLFGKSYDGAIALSCAGILTLLISPLSALDVGFLMSYGCVGAILLLHRPFSRVFGKFLPKTIASLVAISIATQVGILPFIASFFSSLNVLSFFANLIVVPIFSLLFPLLILLTIFSMIIPSAGVVLTVCDWGFSAITAIASFFASTNAYVALKPFDPIFTALMFIIAFVVSHFVMAKHLAKWVLVVWLTLVMSLYTMVRPELNYRGSMVSVLGSSYSRTLILESDSGEMLCVGYDNSLISYYLAQEGLNEIDYIFDAPTYEKDIFGGMVIDEEEGFVGDFKFKRKDGIYTFEFDDVKILFTNLSYSSYNYTKLNERLAEGKYDFVYAENFKMFGKNDFFFATYAPSEFADYSFKEGGSFKYAFDGRVWRID